MLVTSRARVVFVAASVALFSFGVASPPAHAVRRHTRPQASAPWAVAIQGADSNLWTVSTQAGVKQLGLPVRPGTRPSITSLNGGYGVAYSGPDFSLRTYDSRTNTSLNVHLGMAPGTSPSYARLVGTDSSVIALQANNGELWTRMTPNINRNFHIALKAGTSPSVVGLSAGGYEIAYQGADGSLHVYSSLTNAIWNLHLGMSPSTSPSIAALPSGGFTVAMASSRNELWTWTSSVGARNLNTALRPATSPSVAATSTGSEVAAVGSSGTLLIVTTSGSRNTQITPYPGSSAAIAALSNGTFEIAYEAFNGVLYTYDDTNGPINRHLGINAATAPSVTG